MLKEAIDRILELAKPAKMEIDGKVYLQNSMGDYEFIPKCGSLSPLGVGTLTAIVDYITSGADELELSDERRFVIHVIDHKHVWLTMELNADKDREVLLQAETEPTPFPEGKFLDVESFIVALQQYFVPGWNVSELIRMVSNVTDGNSVQQTDDGASQSVTMRKGVSLVEKVSLPNPVNLAPYRTFREIEQPESPFVFRLRGGDSGVTAALFTADGNQWQYEAVQRIKAYFQEHIPAELADDVIILA